MRCPLEISSQYSGTVGCSPFKRAGSAQPGEGQGPAVPSGIHPPRCHRKKLRALHGLQSSADTRPAWEKPRSAPAFIVQHQHLIFLREVGNKTFIARRIVIALEQRVHAAPIGLSKRIDVTRGRGNVLSTSVHKSPNTASKPAAAIAQITPPATSHSTCCRVVSVESMIAAGHNTAIAASPHGATVPSPRSQPRPHATRGNSCRAYPSDKAIATPAAVSPEAVSATRSKRVGHAKKHQCGDHRGEQHRVESAAAIGVAARGQQRRRQQGQNCDRYTHTLQEK